MILSEALRLSHIFFPTMADDNPTTPEAQNNDPSTPQTVSSPIKPPLSSIAPERRDEWSKYDLLLFTPPCGKLNDI
jgi:hypothetical protein